MERSLIGSRSKLHPWLWSFAIWAGFGLVDALQTVFVMRSEGMQHAWTKLFAVILISWLPWALATPLVMRVTCKFPPVRWKSIATWLVHLAACAWVGLSFAAWVGWLDMLLNPYAETAPYPSFLHLWIDKFSNGMLSYLVLYAAILAVSYVTESRARLAYQQTETARLNEQLLKAQLDALRRQIEPHFLFNTLNSVSGLVREGRNESAVNMIAGLSDFLRRVLQESTRQQVPLSEEMEFAQKYLDIQKVRFAERLEFSLDVPEQLMQAQVPTLILQPIVENAIKHGIAKRAQGGTIRIAARRSDQMLTLTVTNDGPSVLANGTAGIGIANIRTRLASLYGDNFVMTLEDRVGGGVEASVSVPFVAAKA